MANESSVQTWQKTPCSGFVVREPADVIHLSAHTVTLKIIKLTPFHSSTGGFFIMALNTHSLRN